MKVIPKQSLPTIQQKPWRLDQEICAKSAKLLLVAHQHNGIINGPPWPLSKEEVDLFKKEGLDELSHELHTEESNISNTRFRVLYQRK